MLPQCSLLLLAESALQPTLPLLWLWSSCRWQVWNMARCRVPERDWTSTAVRWLNWRSTSAHWVSAIFWNRSLIATRRAIAILISIVVVGVWRIVTIWLLSRRAPLNRAILTARICAVRPRSGAVGAVCHARVHRVLRVLVAVGIWSRTAEWHHRLRLHPLSRESTWRTAWSTHIAVSLATVVATTVPIRMSVWAHGTVVACTQAVGERFALRRERILTTIGAVPPAATILGALFVGLCETVSAQMSVSSM